MTLMMWREIAPILFFISVTIKLNSMKTANKLVYSKENYYTENGYENKIKTTISLNDNCHNNMCDWSITADIRRKNEYGIYIWEAAAMMRLRDIVRNWRSLYHYIVVIIMVLLCIRWKMACIT